MSKTKDMKPKFTTPCFIRKNTPELRKELEDLGYENVQQWDDKGKNKCRMLFAGNGLYFYYYIENCSKEFTNTYIDCGENEALFLALAALREDSDYGQWYYDDNGVWEKCNSYMPCRYMQLNGTKATVEDIINHFKTK